MGVVAKGIENAFEILVEEGVIRDRVLPLLELRFRRKLAGEKQPRRFEIARFLRELFDRITAMLEDSFVAVDERDGAATRGGVHERRVVGHQSEVVVARFDLTKISSLDRPFFDRDFIGLAGPIVCDRQGVAGQRLSSRGSIRARKSITWTERATRPPRTPRSPRFPRATVAVRAVRMSSFGGARDRAPARSSRLRDR